MYLDKPPEQIGTTLFSAMPAQYRRSAATDWARANRRGVAIDSFIEAPCFDAAGNLYVVDIPAGRIFRVDPRGDWALAIEYDGEPNGLKFHPDGRLLIADYRNGLMQADLAAGTVRPALARRHSESFKGLNDLTIAANGDVYFTDQGQTGLHDPTGRVFRLTPDGRLDLLLSNVPSPNGIVLSLDEQVLFVAVTRDNAVWRAPIMEDGSLSKVGRFCSLFGVPGPDGLAMDSAGRLVVAHAGLGQVFFFAPDGQLAARAKSCAGPATTNIAYGGEGLRRLFITESATGSILTAQMDVPGLPLVAP